MQSIFKLKGKLHQNTGKKFVQTKRMDHYENRVFRHRAVELYFTCSDRLEPEKDETDTELALRKAMALGCEEIAVLGATGGRADHMMGNVQLLFQCLQKGVFAYLADPQNKIYLLDGEREYQKGQVWGKYISFLPLTERVYGITLEGFKYPLKDRDIEIGTSLCISNELAADEAVITLQDGVLIVVESRDT